MLSILGRTKSKRNFYRCGNFLFVSVALEAYGKLSIGIYISRAISIAYYIKGLVFTIIGVGPRGFEPLTDRL